MAKAVGRKAGGGQGGRGGKIFLILIGFVVLTMGVILRRVQGFKQGKEIREMTVKREALVSEQFKLQESIRSASDRKHIIEIAQSRLGMKMPELNQVIDLPRRPLPSRRDSLRP
jgi:cell division protein FtsL